MDRQALKDCLITTIQITKEVQEETGVPIDAESVVKIAISAFIQMSRNGNGNGKKFFSAKAELPLSFGKYKGKTLMEILKIDRSYLSWLGEKSTIDKIKNKAKELLQANPATKTTIPIPKQV